MKPTWNHPILGQFTYEDDEGVWATRVAVPAFDAFIWERELHDGTYRLVIEAESENEFPSPATTEVALKVLGAQAELMRKVVEALWEDFNGRGPDSGMWWHGDLDTVAQNLDFADLPAPNGPEDLLNVMLFAEIAVRSVTDERISPIAELGFAAAFEDEHGVGVLTDGESILGAGYRLDVTPYESN